MNRREYTAQAEESGQRLDCWLVAQSGEMTRNAVQKLCDDGYVTLMSTGKALPKNHKLRGGETVLLNIPAPTTMNAQPQDIPLDIVYEDNDLLVVNKPKGIVVHPAAGNLDGTLVNALLYHCAGRLSSINGVIRPGIVHRIDKDTSGLLIVAKNDYAHNDLAAQIKAHTFTRVYECVVYGNVKQSSGTVDEPIGRHPTQRKRMCVTQQDSRNAVTHYEVLARYAGFTHLRCRLETGRTHQIRVHMAYMGHPVAGDAVYGPKKVIKALEGQCLHARVIGFIHPVSGEYLEFASELPAYFAEFLSKLENADP